MYSVILMAAMTAPAETTSWGHLFNRGDCCGCSGYSCGGCYGGCCGGYAYYPRYSCGGCCGGCWGGCWGSSCCGGCWGTGGFRTYFTCHGAGACWGYAYAGVGYGFAGCYGSCYGSVNYFSYGHPAAVAYPGCSTCDQPMQAAPQLAPSTPDGAPNQAKPLTPGTPGKTDGKIDTASPANVVVTLPADAVLYANGVRTSQTN